MTKINEYHMVRANKPVSGVRGEDMKIDDPCRVRYYVRAENAEAAAQVLSEKFPNDTLVAIAETLNVKPHFKEAA